MSTSRNPPLSQLAAAWTVSCSGCPDTARLLAEEVRHAALAGGDLRALALANQHLAWFCLMLSRTEDGLRYALLAASLWTDLEDPVHEAVTRGTLAWLMCESGDEEAIVQAQRAVALAESTGDLAARSWVHNALCVVLWMLQQHDLAQCAGAEAVALARRHDDPVALGRWLLNAALPEEGLAALAAQSGQPEAERAHCARSINLTREAATIGVACGDTWAACVALCNLVEWLIRAGRLDEAAAALEEAMVLPGQVTVGRRMVILHMQGLLAMAQGRDAAAVPLLQAGLDRALQVNDLAVGMQIAEALSAALGACGRFEEALSHHRHFFSLYLRRSAERSQVRARLLSRQQELSELETRLARFERLSGEDPLTGLANRRQLDLLLEQTGGSGEPYGIAVIDVDHFKTINDRFTHLVGDDVLRMLGQVLLAATREGDCVGRFGGEEFLLITPAGAPHDGPALCERLRAGIASAEWTRIDPRLGITVSIGYASREEAADVTSVLALADRRLFLAKRLGRNRVVAYGEAA